MHPLPCACLRVLVRGALSIVLIGAASTTFARDCPALPDAPSLHCLTTAQGWFYAAHAGDAARMAEDATQAADAFVRYFERPAPPGAVIAAGTAQPLASSSRVVLAAAGATWQLPWLDSVEKLALQRDAIAAQLRRQMPDATKEAIAARLEASLAARPSVEVTTDRSALRHEIGHMLIRAFWDTPDDGVPTGSAHYGSPGPDWLDELAAVLMESASMTDRRRALLVSDDAARHLVPLATFFSMPHPLASRMRELQESNGVRVISGETAQRLTGDAGWFYVQTRGVADFLLVTGGRDGIFGDIAAFLAAGGDMHGWLSSRGKDLGFPESVAALEVAWQRWIATGAKPPDDPRTMSD